MKDETVNEPSLKDKCDYHFVLLALLHLLRRIQSDDQMVKELYQEVYRRLDKVAPVEWGK